MQPYHVIGLFCEDVREEKIGHTLIGILPDNMNVNQIPGALPKLGIYIRLHIDPITDVGAIKSKLQFPDGVEQPLGGFEPPFIKKTQDNARANGAPHAGFIIIAAAAMVKIPAPGRLLAIVTVAGEEVVCASLNFQLTPDS